MATAVTCAGFFFSFGTVLLLATCVTVIWLVNRMCSMCISHVCTKSAVKTEMAEAGGRADSRKAKKRRKMKTSKRKREVDECEECASLVANMSSLRRQGSRHGLASATGSYDSFIPTQTTMEFVDDCLEAHNAYRQKHGAEPLTLSDELCKYAQEWADTLAAEDKMQHRDDAKYGENIAMKWSSNPKFEITGQDAVVQWYNEIEDHEFGEEPKGLLKSGHFTQVVWKSSRQLGVGKARSASNKIIVVCNYDPPGNWVGEYTDNVPPPI